MLPPVRAALSSNSDFQSLAPAAAARVSLAAVKTAVTVDSDKAGPISGGRMDALSLSAQLKLAQSFSIFAETIGKVLNMPRGENEALVDYATRLSEAVRALNPAERMSIERLLNQIVKGVTLRLLAEILNDPAGPDAARLAAYIETASASERDLAAKAVVSSYRQNGSADPTANGNASRPAPAAQGGTPAGTSGAASSSGAAQTASAALSQTASAATPQQQVQPQDAQESAPPRATNGQQPTQNAGHGTEPTDGHDSHIERPARTGSPTANPQTNAAARGQAGLPPAAEHIIPGQASGTGAVSGSPVSSGMAAADGDAAAAPAAHLRDEAAASPRGDERAKGPRLAETGMRAPSTDGRAGLSNARLMLAELANWMTGLVAAGEATPPAGVAAARLSELPSAVSTEQLTGQDEAIAADGVAKQAAGTVRSAGTTDTPSAARPAEPSPSEGAAGAQPDGSEPLDRQMAMLAGGWTQATREGVPWPYVAYPPGEQEPEREERKARAIAEIGDEEDEAPAQDHSFHGEQQGDEAEQEPPQDGEGQEDKTESAGDARSDEDEGRPNDLYWRMAGWS